MNNKAQMTQVGVLVVLFVGIVVALSIYTGGIAPNIGTVTNTVTNVNKTFTFPAAGSSVVLDGQANTDVTITNRTNGVSVPASNYTITNYEVSTGVIRSVLTAKAGYFNSVAVNVSSTVEPIGYATSSGTRSVVGLIAILSALAVVAVILKKIYDDGLLDSFK